MDTAVDIETARLLLRRWRPSDRAPFAAINADPAVGRFLPAASLTREASDAMLDRIDTHFADHGFGLWAVDRRHEGDLIGFVGLAHTAFHAHFTPAVEIGWRLASRAWGQGYATEAARAVVDHAFTALDLGEIVSFTVPENAPSRRVMERIGMCHDPADDFDHPRMPPGDRLSCHVLYRLRRADA